MTTHAQFYGLLDYMSTSKYERNDLFTLWLERKQIETLPQFTYGRRINSPGKQDLRTAHARLVRLTISLIGNIISLSLAFRVCEELESADEPDINVKEERNVFLFKAVKHVLHGLIYEQDDECFNTGTKPIGITKVSGLSIDDLLCRERRECPILLQLFHGLNYNSGGFARVLDRQRNLAPLVIFIEAEKDNLWKQLTKRMSPQYMENACMDKRYSISNFEVEKKVTLPLLDGVQWRSFFLKQPIPKPSAAAAAARALGGTARSQTNTANSMSGNGPRVAQCYQQQQVTSNQLAGEATSARKPATANNTPSQSSGESDLSSDGKVETPLAHKRATKRTATATASNTPSQSLGESDLFSDGEVESPLAKKSKKEAIPVDDSDDDEDDSNGKRFFKYPFDTYCNESTLSGTDCGIFAIKSPNGLNDTTTNDHRRMFSSVTIHEKDKDRLMYTHNTPINKRMFDDSLVLFAMNWFLELVGSYDIIVFSTLFSDDLRNKDPNYLQKYTYSVRKHVVRKHINLFEKKLVLLPIHEEEHFSLIVLVNPGGLSPLALHFDPCGLHKTATYEAKVQQWLNIEYKRTYDVDDKFSSLELCSGIATRQKNGFDCGAFICLYAHRLIAMFSQLGQEQIEQVSICDVEKVLTIQDPEVNVLHFRLTMNTFLEKLMVLYEKKKGCARMDTDTSCLCIMSKIEAQVKRATSVLNDLHTRVSDEDARLLNEAIATLKETKEDIIRLKMVSSDFATKLNNKSLLDVHGEDSKDDTAMAISSSGSSDHSIDEVSRLQQSKEVFTSDEDTESDDDDDDDDDDKEGDIDHSDEKANASKQIVLCRERWNQYNPSKPFAIQTNLLCWLCRTIEVMIDPNNTHVSLADLPKVITKFISVLKPVVLAYNDLLSSARAKNASSLCNVVGDNEDTEIGKVIITLDAMNNEAALSENNATLLKIQKAILLDKNEPRNEEDLQQKASSVTTATINTYIRLGHPTRNMLMHMLHILFVHFILDELNLTVASSHLSHDAIENLLSNTANLATKVPSQAVEYSPDLPINILLVQFIIPALNKSETLVEATAVLLGIFDCLAGPGVHNHLNHPKLSKIMCYHILIKLIQRRYLPEVAATPQQMTTVVT